MVPRVHVMSSRQFAIWIREYLYQNERVKNKFLFNSICYARIEQTIVICIIGHTAPNSQIAKGYLLQWAHAEKHSSACYNLHFMYAWKAKDEKRKKKKKYINCNIDVAWSKNENWIHKFHAMCFVVNTYGPLRNAVQSCISTTTYI